MTSDPKAKEPERGQTQCALRLCTIVVTLTVLLTVVFGSLLDAPYLFDDRSVILENTALQSERPLSGWYWQPHPVRYLTLLVDRAFGFSPFVGHAINLGVHGLVSLFVWLLVRSWTRRCWLPPLVAISFMLNPLVIEAVGIVSHRKDLLAALFVLLGIHWSDSRRTRWLIWPCWVIAFFSKETALVLPGLWLMHRMGKSRMSLWVVIKAHRLFLAGFVVLGGVLAVAGWQVAASRPPEFGGGDGWIREATNVLPADAGWLAATVEASASFLRYLVHLFLPLPRSIDPPVWGLADRAGWIQGAVVVAAFAVVFLAFLGARRKTEESIGWWWGMLAILPVVFPWLLMEKGVFLFADRYLYLALPGFLFAFLGWGCRRYRLLIPLWVSAMIVFSVAQVREYRTETRYWQAVLRANSDSIWALNNLAASLLADAPVDHGGRTDEERLAWTQAEGYLSRAVSLRPDFAGPRLNLVALLINQRRLGEADRHLSQVERDAPGQPDAVGLRALWLAAKGRSEEAIPRLRQGLAAATDPEVRHRFTMALAQCLLDSGMAEDALALLDDDARLLMEPDSCAMKARILIQQGQFAAAESWLEEVQRMYPDHEGLREARVDRLLHMMQWVDAEALLMDALRVRPRHAGWARRLGWILRHRGAFAQALEVERRAGIFDAARGRAFLPLPGEPDRILVVHPPGQADLVHAVRDTLDGQGYPLMHVFGAPLDLQDAQGVGRVLHQYQVVQPSLVFAVGIPVDKDAPYHEGLTALRAWGDVGLTLQERGAELYRLLVRPEKGEGELTAAMQRYARWSGGRFVETPDGVNQVVIDWLEDWFYGERPIVW